MNILSRAISITLPAECDPDFQGIFEDYASETVKGLSEAIVNKYLDEITDEDVKKQTLVRMKMIAAGIGIYIFNSNIWRKKNTKILHYF